MKYRILLLDDEPLAYDLLMNVIDQYLDIPYGDSIDVTWADTVRDAEKEIRYGGWSVAICDISFSEQRESVYDPSSVRAGLDLVRLLAQLRGQNDKPKIIVLTQYSAEQDIAVESKKAGADEFLGKHISRFIMAEYLKEALQLSSQKPIKCERVQSSSLRPILAWS